MSIVKKIKTYFKRKRRIKKLQKLFPVTAIKPIENTERKKPLDFKSSKDPEVSVIIPFYNQLDYTVNCLNHLHDHLTGSFEIILIDDNSSEDCDLSFIKGIRVVKNQENQGFLRSINIGIKASAGKSIYILNNDTEVKKGFLEELLYVFDNFPNAGAVGSKILNADGSLQEAGAVFLKGGEIHQIFTKKEKYYPEVNYVHKVDYCSGCSLLFKKNNDRGEINLFDEQFAPAYFEETDFCFQLKYLQGKDIYYTPFSEVLHYNGISYNSMQNDNAYKLKRKEELFAVNLKKFRNKWKQQIDAIKAATIAERIQELYNYNSVVFFCGAIPAYDKDSGSNRLKEIIEAYLKMGYYVLMAKNKTYLPETEKEYILFYERMGVNVFYEHNLKINIGAYLQKNITNKAIAWFYNPDVFEEYYEIAIKHLPKAKLVFDMVDIHHLRYERAAELELENKLYKKQKDRYLKIERNAAKLADHVITISEFDEKYMHQFCDAKKIITISNIHYIKTNLQKTLNFEDRKDILFIGSQHAPNIDALYFLYNEIMLHVWKKIPDLKVNVIGNVKDCIKNINHPNFIFRGYVPNIEPYFFSNRLMIAPLRYGAGVKGKIGQAFEYFLPVVTTSIGAEGMHLINNENALINDDPVQFANSIIKLYCDKELWLRLQNNSEKSLWPFSLEKLKQEILKLN
jgi:O-antigen biosynthesis protein